MSPAEEMAVSVVRPVNPLGLIDKAIDKGMSVDQLGGLMKLAEQWNRDRAAEAFANAVTAFQAECPTIKKSRRADGSKIQFDFASYDDVMRVAGPIMARHGIAVSYTTTPAQGGITITCRVRVGIHQEETTLTMPIPAGTVNNTQLAGQAVTYLKRYALCMALNIIVTDEDQDATDLVHTIGTEEVDALKALIVDKEVRYDLFLKYASEKAQRAVNSLEEIPRRIYPMLLKQLQMKRKEAAKS